MMHVSEAEEEEAEEAEEEAEEEEEEEVASSSAAEGANDKLETAGKAKVDGNEAAVADTNADNEDTFEAAVTVSETDEEAIVVADSAVSLLVSAAAAQTYFSIGSDSTIALRTSRSRCSICC